MRRLTNFFFLAALACCTFERLNWNIAGAVNISDVLALSFLVSYSILMRPRVPATTATLLGFFAAFMVVYLIGFFNLETAQGLDQFVKGLIKFMIHFAFLAIAVAWLWRRGQSAYWQALAWFRAAASTGRK